MGFVGFLGSSVRHASFSGFVLKLLEILATSNMRPRKLPFFPAIIKQRSREERLHFADTKRCQKPTIKV